MRLSPSFWILFLIMIVNAMGFGIIFPVLYPYAKTLGINEGQLGWLIACFPLAQLFATPILGKLSDKIGRKPVLVGSLLGTAVSFYLFAEAGSLAMLFFARSLDGITGGNISVAHAVIADSTPKENRPKAFGLLAAALGIGFLLGPILGGFLGDLTIRAPFYFAAGISALSFIIAWAFLKESNTLDKRKTVPHTRFIHQADFNLVFQKPTVYLTMMIGLITATANFGMFTGVQTFCIEVLDFDTLHMGYLFGLFAIASIFTQVILLKPTLTYLPNKALVLGLVAICACLAMFFCSFSSTWGIFSVSLIVYALFNSYRDPLIQSIISESVDESRQGIVLGINQSALSIGQIIGPIMAGYAANHHYNLPFAISAILLFIAFGICIPLIRKLK